MGAGRDYSHRVLLGKLRLARGRNFFEKSLQVEYAHRKILGLRINPGSRFPL